MSGAPPERTGPTFARRRSEVPGSPRALLREAMGAVPDPRVARLAAEAAEVAKVPAVRDAWTAAEDGTAEAWMAAADATRRWLRPPPPESKMDLEVALRKAMMRSQQCGTCQRVYEEDGTQRVYLAAMRCRARCCLDCLRKALKATTNRWAPLFAAPVRPGWRASFVTVGNRQPVRDRGELGRYVRKLGDLLRYMREGLPSCGIAPRSWVAGLRALEVVPRAAGGFAHAHLLVICRDFWPYGLHEEELRKLAHPTTKDRGFRALLRQLGIGEVFRDDKIEPGGADPCANYMAKIERYISKVERADDPTATSGADDLAAMPWDGREDLQRAMRGARLLESWGDARGLLGGPDRMHRARNGTDCGRLVLRGIYDPADEATWGTLVQRDPTTGERYYGVADEDGPETTITRETSYTTDTLESWREWCDVDTLRAKLLTPL